jgi:inorganic pyrophosphatase
VGKAMAYYEGQSVSIHDCAAQRCALSFEVLAHTNHAEAKGDLTVESDARAIARLGSFTAPRCTLTLEKTDGDRPSITVRLNTGDCSYFATLGASFEHVYPLHSRALFFASGVAACYASKERAMLTLCADPELEQLASDWTTEYWKAVDVDGKRPQTEAEREKILGTCESSSDVPACLKKSFSNATVQLKDHQKSWMTAIGEVGDAAEAQKAIAAIVGSYRRTFANGDVQGDHFQSTDTLNIQRESAGSIKVTVQLEFFNGRQCSHEGVAAYRKTGFFTEVVRRDFDEKTGPPCVFEVLSTARGIELHDPAGMCKMQDCGARGGYNGAVFAYNERVGNVPSGAKQIVPTVPK